MSLNIDVNLLTGRYVATSPNDREQVEWPPHPARLFSAMVAAHHEVDSPDPLERTALQWLESQPPPAIYASDATERSMMTHFVPVNDESILGLTINERRYVKLQDAEERLVAATTDAKRKSAQKAIDKARDVIAQVASAGKTSVDSAQKLFPEYRGKQARTYPSVTPDEPTVTYHWNVELPEDLRPGLLSVLERTTRVGHSSSLTACSLRTTEPSGLKWAPDVQGSRVLRTVQTGQLTALERRFNERRLRAGDSPQFVDVEPRTMPYVPTRYLEPGQIVQKKLETIKSVYANQWTVLVADDGPIAELPRTVAVARAVRGAIMTHMTAQHELVSGHQPDGSLSDTPHLAVVPLPHVGHQHANGQILGVALLLPETDGASDGERLLFEALRAWRQEDGTFPVFLRGGRRFNFTMKPRIERKTVQPYTWSRPSTTWVSVTPVALDHNPKFWGNRDSDKAQRAEQVAVASIIKSCEAMGLPCPVDVQLTTQPLITGSVPAGVHAPYRSGRGQGSRPRFLLHTKITFGSHVQGPIVLGAGRHFGMGLMRPVKG